MRYIILLSMINNLCFGGIIHISFSDSTSSVDIDYNELRNIEFCDSSMIFVQGGTFEMGDHYNRGATEELPVHSVSVSDFYITKTEIAWEEWRTIMDNFVGMGEISGDGYPVNNISWYDAIVYCNKRSIMEGLIPCYSILGSTNPTDWGEIPTVYNPDWEVAECNWVANGYRLPTEAEWEYAARGGIHNTDDYEYSGCHEETALTNYAWYSANSGNYLHQAGIKSPNQIGIYDMSGNLEELCWDSFNPNYFSDCYNLGTVYDPTGPLDRTWGRILKGGDYLGDSYFCRVSYRVILDPVDSSDRYGFRVVRKP
ncbi:MAG: SUMF1/EgtB/PvdO family nonheme iron enzyme [Candidatus Delongbacteria bacterium]|jgi:sulfatase modifying factor 1|nr:SUMF1/EgtB/PvdO family nonheme iron enzyme [Candidatus Delongbacteria bacterium]